jgi:nucleotide-binding universal stress UspA family protein
MSNADSLSESDSTGGNEMNAMRTILVGTDFTPDSDRAFSKACEIAQGMGERVHLLHVVERVDEPDSADPDTQKFYAALTVLSEVKLETEKTANQRPVAVTHSVEIGPRVETIQRVADELEADLIVLGRSPRNEDNTFRFGVSQRVAWFSTRPVLLVP